jgi:hypothetical protein
MKIFESLCFTCKKHCGGHFDIASVYECDDYIRKDTKPMPLLAILAIILVLVSVGLYLYFTL